MRHESDTGPLGIITWRMGVEGPTHPPQLLAHPIPQTGAKPFLAGADRGLEGKDRVGGHNMRKDFEKQPPRVAF